MKQHKQRSVSLWLSLAALFCASPNIAHAKALHLGLGGGLNWTKMDSVSVSNSVSPSGVSYAGSLMANLFQDNWIGFRLAADYLDIRTTDGNTYERSRWTLESAALCFNFNLFQGRHSIGIGAATAQILRQENNNSDLNYSRSMPAALLDGKDMWKVGASQDVFLMAKVFLPMPDTGPITVILSVLLGYDF